MITNKISQTYINFNRSQQTKTQTPYADLRNRNAGDVFVSSTPKQVSFCGFLDFLNSKKKETDEEKFEKIFQNVSNIQEDFRTRNFGYNLFIKKLEKEVDTIEPNKQQAFIVYLMNKIIDTTDVDDDYFNLTSISNPMFGLIANNIIPYTTFDNAAKNVGYSSFISFQDVDTFIEETKAIKINRILDTAEPFDLKSFEEVYDKINHIEMRFSINNDNQESVKFVLNNLPDIFYTKDNAEEYKNLLKKIDRTIRKDADWGIQDEFGNNLAYRAVLAENPLLVDFAKKKKIDFNAQNKSGECALDVINKLDDLSCIKSITNDIKIDNKQFLDLAQIDLTSGLELLFNEPKYNVNTKDSETGDTALTIAAKENSKNAFKCLLTHPEIDVNAVNKFDQTAGMIAAENGNADFIRLLNDNENFDINYINSEGDSIYSLAKNQETLDAIMENPKANPNISNENFEAPIFRVIKHSYRHPSTMQSDFERFKMLCKCPQVDLNIISKNGDDILQYLCGEINENLYYYDFFEIKDGKELVTTLQKELKNRHIDKTKQIVEQEGVLTLEQIMDFLQYPELGEDVNTPLNDMDEGIGFFIADIEPNKENLSQYLEVLSLFKDQLIYYDINKKNKAGQSVYAKALDAENKLLIEYLKKYAGEDK